MPWLYKLLEEFTAEKCHILYLISILYFVFRKEALYRWETEI